MLDWTLNELALENPGGSRLDRPIVVFQVAEPQACGIKLRLGIAGNPAKHSADPLQAYTSSLPPTLLSDFRLFLSR
jgi:hypothetical protein